MSIGTRQAIRGWLSTIGFAFIIIAVVVFIGVVATAGSISTDYLASLGQVATFGMALLAIGLAVSSNVKMESIANVQFLQTVDKLEDARIEFIKTFQGIPGYSPELFTWKTKSCVKMAVELLKRDVENRYIDSTYQDDLFFYFNTSFIHFIKNTDWKKEEKSQKHMIQSYAMLDEYYNETRKKELEDFITDETEFKDFYKRVEEFKKTPIEKKG